MDDVTVSLDLLSVLQRHSLALLLVECAGAALAVQDRGRREGHRIRPRFDVVLERWSHALTGSVVVEREPSPSQDVSVAHVFPPGGLEARFDRVVAWSSPPEDEIALLEWLGGSPDAIPNQLGLVAECARDLLVDRAPAARAFEDLLRNVRDLFGLTEVSSAFDALLPGTLDLARACDGSHAALLRARTAARDRADAAFA